nr:MAG TPA: hypothetical protein [Caudoviricetes sp.]
MHGFTSVKTKIRQANWFGYPDKNTCIRTGISCASHAHIKESLSVVSLGKPLPLGGFIVRQAHV